MKYDVIVCGAGPSGISAALSAKRNGSKVLLIEETGTLGGNSVNALVEPWMTFHKNDKLIINGIAGEIVERLVKEGNSLGHITDPLGFCSTLTPINIEGLKSLLFDMIYEEKIDLLLHSFVFGVEKEGNLLKKVKVMTKNGEIRIDAKVFIDCTGDGDLSKFAGAKYIYGRDKDNLAQPMTMIFHVGNVDIKKLKESIKNDSEDFIIRDDYDFEYLAISGFFKAVKKAKEKNDFNLNRDRVLLFEEILPNTVSINMTRVQKLKGTDAFQLTEAEVQGRQQIKTAFNFLKKYIPGFEQAYILTTPSKIGVRETRHIIGEYVLTLEDIAKKRYFNDTIALSGFPIDIHSPDGSALNLPEIDESEPIPIPLRSLIVKGLDNLLVAGRCMSATHEACAAIRTIPTVMAVGQAAGVMASLYCKQEKPLKNISVEKVQTLLKEQGQIL